MAVPDRWSDDRCGFPATPRRRKLLRHRTSAELSASRPPRDNGARSDKTVYASEHAEEARGRFSWLNWIGGHHLAEILANVVSRRNRAGGLVQHHGDEE